LLWEKIATEPEGSCITLLSEPSFSATSEKKWNKKEDKVRKFMIFVLQVATVASTSWDEAMLSSEKLSPQPYPLS